MNTPLLKGGQGHSTKDVFDAATGWGWICLACVLAMLLILSTGGTILR